MGRLDKTNQILRDLNKNIPQNTSFGNFTLPNNSGVTQRLIDEKGITTTAAAHHLTHEVGGADAVTITHAQTTGQTASDHHAPVTVTDTNTINLTLVGQDVKGDVRTKSSNTIDFSNDAGGMWADVRYQDTNSIDLGADASGLKADLKYQDTTSVDLAVDASGLKATVLPAGVNHDALLNYDPNDHIDWTNSASNFETTGTAKHGTLTLKPVAAISYIYGGTAAGDDLYLSCNTSDTKPYIQLFGGASSRLMMPTGTSFIIDVNANDEYIFDATTADFKANNITTTGTITTTNTLTSGATRNQGTGTSASLSKPYGMITFVGCKDNISDNAITTIAKIYTTNEGGVDEDGGGWHAIISGHIGHDCTSTSTDSASKGIVWHVCRAQKSTGAGTNSAILEISETASAATTGATKDISTVTPAVSEVSEYEVNLRMTIDLTGTSVGTASFVYEVKLFWYGYKTPPTIGLP